MKIVTAGFALAFAASPAVAVELIANGGFETGDFTGWTRFGGLGQTDVNAADAFSGAFGARFSPNSPGGITQLFATAPGTSYVIGFDLRHLANLREPLNGVTISFGTDTLLAIDNAATVDWTSYSFLRVAADAATELRFTFRDNRDAPPNRYSLDNASVIALAVPEPAVWALLIAGFGLVGLAARRRAPGKIATGV